MADRKDRDKGRSSMLLHALAAYGADPRRWPPAARRALAEGGEDEGAELRHAREEARELDRLLDLAPRPHVPVGAARRAATAILSTDPMRSGSDNVVAVDFQARPGQGRPAAGFSRLAGVAALAASLVLGIYVGASDVGDLLIPSAVTGTSLSGGDYDIVQHALAGLEEDMG